MHRLLDSILAMLALLYNAALEERILAHRMPGKSISLYDHYKLLPTIRREAAEQWHSDRCNGLGAICLVAGNLLI